jgi:hypothetical protein
MNHAFLSRRVWAFVLVLSATLGCAAPSPSPASPAAPAPMDAPVPSAEPALPTEPDVLPPPASPAEEAAGAACMNEGDIARDWVAAACSETCSSARIVQRRCEGSRWQELPPIEPTCECAPKKVPSVLKACVVKRVELTPTKLGASDTAKLTLSCGETALQVDCDGEQDGTGTSLCTCYRNGEEVRIPGDPWPGEGIEVSYRVAERCLRAR